jgi:signal transduction histidine kinase
MKLSSFLVENMETILREWEAFARTQEPAARDMTALALRDHARLILQAIALDIDTVESDDEQYQKSRGLAPPSEGRETAASTHGALRQLSGFSLLQLTAEFRALRATVLRLWLPTVETVTKKSTYDMVRFNETIDQALAESVVTYSERAANTRDTFLAILGHDLRSPLANVSMAGALMRRPNFDPAGIGTLAASIERSSRLMTSMVNDLLEYARSQLGTGIPIAPTTSDLGAVCRSAMEDAQASNPDCEFSLSPSGELVALLDANRLHQVVSNLLNNAAQHRAEGSSVLMSASGEADTLFVRVRNVGKLIPEEAMQSIFSAMVQLEPDAGDGRASGNMGLGLFIAKAIVEAHGGTITVTSSASDGTEFCVRLPRLQPAD